MEDKQKDVKQTGTEVAVPTNDAVTDVFLTAADDAGSRDTRLKFKKGRFVTGKDDIEIPAGGEYVAFMHGIECGWKKFQFGAVIDGPRGKVAAGFRPPTREDLGDNDPDQWEEENGRPRDPWFLEYSLGLINVKSGQAYLFSTSSDGGKRAVGTLMRTFARNAHRGNPVIKLEAGSYPHKKFGRVDEPKFTVVDWEQPQPSLGVELNDRIPF